jgi:hypothetical protein
MDELQLPQTCPYYPTKITIEQQPIISFGILKNPKTQKEKNINIHEYSWKLMIAPFFHIGVVLLNSCSNMCHPTPSLIFSPTCIKWCR